MNAILSAFQNSWRGLIAAARSERAVRQELLLLVAAIPLAVWMTPRLWVRVMLIASILFVLAVEFLNTAIEKLCDHVTPHHHPTIGFVKDLGSAAVLCALVLAALVWGAAAVEALL
jgi:diacylglycerol kinase (ATP)